MSRGAGAAIRAARKKGKLGLAWASFAVAIVGGTFAAGVWIGHVISAVLGVIPWPWVSAVLLLVGVVAIVLDLFLDGEPNKVAIYGGILVPSVATAAPGKLGDKIGEWTGALTGWLDGVLIEWLGTSSSAGLALACIICSILMARRVIKKSGKSSALAEV